MLACVGVVVFAEDAVEWRLTQIPICEINVSYIYAKTHTYMFLPKIARIETLPLDYRTSSSLQASKNE
jgi:hypothetical protein